MAMLRFQISYLNPALFFITKSNLKIVIYLKQKIDMLYINRNKSNKILLNNFFYEF